jgi:Zn finger protein HypA/HybF involved in hydrogenase expression
MNDTDHIWLDRFTKLTVHCLKCDDIFQEAKQTILTCPHCNNADMQQTVYLQGDEE